MPQSIGFSMNVLGYNHTRLHQVIFCIIPGILYWLKVLCSDTYQTLTEMANPFRAHQLYMYSSLKYSLTWSPFTKDTYSFQLFSLSFLAWISWSLVLLVKDWGREGIQYLRLVMEKSCLTRSLAPLSNRPYFASSSSCHLNTQSPSCLLWHPCRVFNHNMLCAVICACKYRRWGKQIYSLLNVLAVCL